MGRRRYHRALESRHSRETVIVSRMITAEQRESIHRVLDLFDETGVRYQCTGGFAGVLHGSRWPLHDLDLDVGAAEMSHAARALGAAVTRPASPYRDDEFDLVLLQANVGGLGVDVSQAEGARLLTATGWASMGVDLSRREFVAWDGRSVPVVPLADLIAYKRRLASRVADVAELGALLLARS